MEVAKAAAELGSLTYTLSFRPGSPARLSKFEFTLGWHVAIYKARPTTVQKDFGAGIRLPKGPSVSSREQNAQGCRPLIEHMAISISGNQRIAINFSSIYYIHVASNPPFG